VSKATQAVGAAEGGSECSADCDKGVLCGMVVVDLKRESAQAPTRKHPHGEPVKLTVQVTFTP
jgi:hypothetical protein